MAKINADVTNRTTGELDASLKKTLPEGYDASDWLEKMVQARDMEMEKNG